MVESRQILAIRQKYEALAPLLTEPARRRWAACEAVALGRGGISLVARATGLSRPMIRRGIAELTALQDGVSPTEQHEPRQRRPGGGRHRLTTTDPTL